MATTTASHRTGRGPRTTRTATLLAALVAALLSSAVLAGAAGAATTTFGSPLQNAPNVTGGCESKPMVSPQDFDTYVPVPSNAASCTWWQIGTFGVDPATDTRRGYVPGDGTITSVTIRSGPNPAPLRIVVARQLTAFGPNAPLSGPVCCVYAGQSDELRPTANSTTTFPLNLPVEHHRDLQKGIQTDDIVGISAQSGAGTLPLFAIPGRTRQSAFTQTGTLDAAGMWPALGTQPNDTGGGRSNEGFAGFEVTASYTFCDGAATRDRATSRATCGSTGGAGAGGGGAGGATGGGAATGGGSAGGSTGTTASGAPVAVRVALPRQRLRDVRRRGAVTARCTLQAAGTCTVRVSVARAVARRLRIPARAGAASVQIASARVRRTSAGTTPVRARLTRAARRALRSARGTVRATVAATGETPGRPAGTTSATLVLRR